MTNARIQTACPPTEAFHLAYAGHASADETDQLLQHAAHCAQCMTIVAELQEGDSGLRQAFRATPATGTRTTTELPILPLAARSLGTDLHLPGSPIPHRPRSADLAFLDPPIEPDEIGRLAHFRILRQLGAGGMGVVLVAEDTFLRRPVALKVMRSNVTASPTGRERFLSEARAAAALRCEQVVTIHAVGVAGDVPYLAMELLEGEPLDERLRRLGTLSVSATVTLATQIALGLSAAHAKGLIHRDIKPANVFLTSAGGVKLLDFGLARQQDAPGLTEPGLVVGTPGYMAPEQARGEATVPQTDLFSLGCVLYRCLTGRDPFTGSTVLALLTALAVDEPAPIRQLAPHVPVELDALVRSLLAKPIEQRPASADRVIAQLQALPTSTPASVRGRVVAALALGLAAVWVVLLAVVVIRIRTPDGKETVIPLPEGTQVTVTVENGVPVDELADWRKATVKLVGPARMDAVEQKLKELNPGYQPVAQTQLLGSAIIRLTLPASGLRDLRPLSVLTDLQDFRCDGTPTALGNIEDLRPLAELKELLHLFLDYHPKLTDLTPLQKLSLSPLSIYNTGVTDLRPLRAITTLRAINIGQCRWLKPEGVENLPLLTIHLTNCPQVREVSFLAKMPLERLHMSGTSVRDFKPLAGLKLLELEAVGVPVTDIGPLAGMPLTRLDLSNTSVSDLTPIAESPVTWLNLFGTPVRDLAPLRKLPLTWLNLLRTPATDFTPLHRLPLTELHGTFDLTKEGPWLRKLPRLQTLNHQPLLR